MTDRDFWLEIRRAMIIAIKAIEKAYEIDSCIITKAEKQDATWMKNHLPIPGEPMPLYKDIE